MATTTLTFAEVFAIFNPLIQTAKDDFLMMITIITSIGLGLAVLGWGIAKAYGLVRGR